MRESRTGEMKPWRRWFTGPVSHAGRCAARQYGPAVEEYGPAVRSSSGQALVEYILVLPVVLVLIVNVVNFAGFFYAWIAVANASRAAADYAIMGGSTVRDLSTPVPSATVINSLIATDIASLPNKASLVVDICQRANNIVTTISGTCTAVPNDPEANTYTVTTVDVTYTYQPFIPASFQFPGLNVYATMPPTSIHRRAIMRLEP